ncbi:programmed cell death protein 2-like [Trichechus inunguis]|uniref:Programmed cell death protein 2-like n=1 Tax=Trichechus manatus latirostris TaxID=127582 RepID=A0A2Y9FV25_TRIMA|nr:programmed cell death protein 2-like [Trichechus manatus latirostris]
MAAFRKPVLLGLRDTAVHGCPTGPDAWTTSKLGGVPDALPAVATPRPVCGRCGQLLALAVQVYCPLEGSPFHRLLHVFACARPNCDSGGSWKVFRSQCLQIREKEAPDAQKQEDSLAAQDWCEGADDWGSDSEEVPPPRVTLDFGNDANSAKHIDWSAQLQDLSLQDAVLDAAHPTPPGEELSLPEVPQFLPYYISVVDEDDYRDFVNLDHAHGLLREYQQREGIDMERLLSQSLSSDGGDEKYEKTIIKSGDKMFYKFMKRIAACQEQILRYSWDGEPLFLSCLAPEVIELPACSHCGGRRIFEFQLMPALVSMLRSADLGLSVEFGTILIYTCEKSCWPQNHHTPVEEFCIVQEDPDELFFK